MYITNFTVKGSYTFPVDMLRYDACYPTYTDAAVKLVTGGTNMAAVDEDYMVQLAHAHPTRGWQPTIARWASFGFEVMQSRIRTAKCS